MTNIIVALNIFCIIAINIMDAIKEWLLFISPFLLSFAALDFKCNADLKLSLNEHIIYTLPGEHSQ